MARTDTLGNFLTDVASAIRTKAGTSDLIQASTFDTAIENLPSGGVSTPTSVGELNDAIIELRDAFNTYMLAYPSTYEADSSEAITLYTPDANCQYYGIQKRSSGNYRIFWTSHPILILYNNISRINWGYSSSYDSSSTTIETTAMKFLPSVLTSGMSGNQFYVSSEYNTLSECVQRLQSNSTSYSVMTNTNGLGYVADTNYVVPYSNITYVDNRVNDGIWPLSTSKRISSNETIST